VAASSSPSADTSSSSAGPVTAAPTPERASREATAAPGPIVPAEAPKAALAVLAPPPAAGPRPPELLGTLNLRRSETISGLIHRVYGNYSNKNFRFIILANPQIDDPDRVEVGHSIRFPAIPISVTPSKKESCWVRIEEKTSLQEALDLLRAYPESAPPVRLIPYWQPVTGMRFAVILKQPFTSPEAAQVQMRLLPAGLAASGQVLTSWGEKTVFFADPYYVK
jgi:hypothetical protein